MRLWYRVYLIKGRSWMDKTGIYVEDEKMPQAYANSMKTMRELTAWRLKHGDSIQ